MGRVHFRHINEGSEYAKIDEWEFFAENYRAYLTRPDFLKEKNEPAYNIMNEVPK